MTAEPLRNPYEGEDEMDAEEVLGEGYAPAPPSLAGPRPSRAGRSSSSGISGVAAYAPPPGPPPPPDAGYAFSAPGHSFSGPSSSHPPERQ